MHLLDKQQHFLVQTSCRNTRHTIFVHITRLFQYLQNTLFGQCRSKDDRKIHKRSETVADSIFESLHHLHSLVLHQVPFVHHNHQPLAFFCIKEKIFKSWLSMPRVKRLPSKYIHLNFQWNEWNGLRVVAPNLIHSFLLTDTRRIYQVEIKTEFIVAGIDESRVVPAISVTMLRSSQ